MQVLISDLTIDLFITSLSAINEPVIVEIKQIVIS